MDTLMYPRLQTLLKRSKHNNKPIFIVSEDHFELPQRAKRAKANIFHMFQRSNIRDFRILFLDKSRKDRVTDVLRILDSCSWIELFRPITIAMDWNKFGGRYLLDVITIFVPDTNWFIWANHQPHSSF